MKISDIVYTTLDELNEMPRFDLAAKPIKAKWYLQLVAWILSFPETFVVHSKIKKTNMKGLKPPYILLCNHNSFLDFKVATRAVFPHRSSYIVAVDGFINRESLMRNVGCFGKRKFMNDSRLIRPIKHSLEVNKDVCQIYPEARYSLVGTTSPLPESLGKLIKLLKQPVVMLLSHGHHLRQPFWNLHPRKIRTTSELTQILTKDDIERMTVDEINDVIATNFQYDEYQYQLDNKIVIDYKDRAKNLFKVLYQCPKCHAEFQMKSDTNRIWCEACGDSHEMDEYGQLHNTSGETTFAHIPDWFEWIRSNVRTEVDSGTYQVEMDVHVDALPNSTGYYRLGVGTLTHDENGFHLVGNWDHGTLDVHRPVQSTFGAHIEYDYFGKGDCVSFSTYDDTYYLYPVDQKYSVTKFHFAAEELYRCQTTKK